MTALYICYQSVFEPLTRTQVVPYLEGLAAAGHAIVLLTFERKPLAKQLEVQTRRELETLGVLWHWTRYHKRPSVPATSWDIAAGVAVGARLSRRYGVSLYHGRSHVPAVIASALKRIRGGRFLFDLRGFLADEYVDAGVWPAGGTLYRATKKIEAHLIREADGLVVLTRGAGELLSRWYPSAIAGKPVTVIPCCVDMRRFTNQLSAPRPKPGPMVYVGKLGGWYWLDAMLRFYSAAVRLMPELKLAIFTQSDSAPARNCVAAAGLQSSAVSISYVMPDEIPARLAGASGGLSFIRPGPSKSASSPTKLGEYLAAGVPAIANAGIGDVDSMLADRADGPIGVVVDPRSESELGAGAARLRDLLADANMPGRCREAAREHLGLITVGWPRYRALYEQIGCA